jgi:aspartate carbamoyltransferase regulatory subunit
VTDQTPSGASKVRQVEAIANGTVIDHIPGAMTLKVAALVAGREDQVFIGMNLRSARQGRKGVVKISGRELSERSVSSLALIAPEATISIIRDYAVVSKAQVPVPSRFEDIARCANPNCVTNHEKWSTRFEVVGRGPLRVRCVYCERSFDAAELTLI